LCCGGGLCIGRFYAAAGCLSSRSSQCVQLTLGNRRALHDC
jgi:hypothetical protein